jgi:hypothetical protein
MEPHLYCAPGEYTQQYDTRGHPENRESRQLARRARRAQNDVLSTIGVCASVDENGKLVNMQAEKTLSPADMQQTMLNIHENLAGFRVSMIEDVLHGLFTIWCSNIRKRIMTFDFYLGIPILVAVKSEWRHLGPIKFLFAGLLPSATLHVCVFSIEAILEYTRERIQGYMMPGKGPLESRRGKRILVRILDAM